MVRSTKFTPAKVSHDVNTPAGFLAEFDAQIVALGNHHGYCTNGYAYEWSGIITVDGKRQRRIPDPGDRARYLPNLPTVPREWLNETGLAEVAKAETGLLDRFREGALTAAETVCNSNSYRSYAPVEEVNAILANLGLPALTMDRHRSMQAYVSGTYIGPEAEVTRQTRTDLAEKIAASVTAIMAEAGFTVEDPASISHEVADYGLTGKVARPKTDAKAAAAK